MNINLHIERLVMDGVSVEPHQREELKAAVQTQLSHLLMSNGIGSSVQSYNNFREISGSFISIEKNSDPSDMGQQVAGAIFRGIEQ